MTALAERLKAEATPLHFAQAAILDASLFAGGRCWDGLNRYAYCRNNPVRYTDPTGHDVGNAENDGYDNNRNPVQVESHSVATRDRGDKNKGEGRDSDICITITIKPGRPTNEAQRQSMAEHPTGKTSDIILVKDGKVTSSQIDGGVPPGFDLFANIALAKSISPFGFYKYVNGEGDWDFKKFSKDDFEAFGNWHYGLVGRAFGWPRGVLSRMAGWAQVRDKTSRPEWGSPLGGPPYGDDPVDQQNIESGTDFYEHAY
jgi:hypothetical protein